MQVSYNPRTDLLYLRFDERTQQVENKRIAEDVVLDLGEDDRIVGIEIMDASTRIDLSQVLPVTFKKPDAA